ncbi:MAG: MFS transporter [Nitrospiraceae bacterium]|nr:MAG: MFS transporter [Nitrospiraceae bacterium]
MTNNQAEDLNHSENKLPHSFWWLNATQFAGALNDNIFKLLIVFFLIHVNGADKAGTISAMAGAVFVVPFLLFSSASGILADRISKQRIIVVAKTIEVIVMLLGTAAFFAGNEYGLYLTLFLMGSHSALFAPAKYGIVPELVKTEQLSKANSFIESFTYLAIIMGTAVAPFLSMISANYALAAIWCVVVAIAGLLTSLKIEHTSPAGSTRKASAFFLGEIWETLGIIRKDGYLFLAVLGSAYFMFAGAFSQINLIPYGIEILSLTQEQSGYLFFVAALGIGIGSYMSGRLSGRNIEFGVVPIGAIGLSLSLAALHIVPVKLAAILAAVFALGIGAGLFIVPLQSFIQFRSPNDRRGEVLATAGFLGWISVLLASGFVYLLTGYLKISASKGFMIIGAMTMLMTLITLYVLPDFLVRFLALICLKLFYRIRVIGINNIPVSGPALLVPNHVSWVDALLLTATQQRRIRFLMERSIYETWYLNPLLKLMGVIPISSDDPPKEILRSIKQAREAITAGYMVCIFAEGAVTRNGMIQSFKEGLERIVKGTEAPVIPVYLGGLWGSIFSYAHGRLVSRWPVKLPYPVTIIFGRPIAAGCTVHEVRQAVEELSCDYFNSKKSNRRSLPEALINSARKHWKRPAISDSTGKRLSYGEMLTASILFSAELKKDTAGSDKVGVLLPSTAGGALVNLGLTIIGKVPVNLNYTASIESVCSAIEQCGIKQVITSKAFMEKIALTGMPINYIYLEDVSDRIKSGVKLSAWIKARLLPVGFLVRRKGFDPDTLATIIFSSGSTGDPKGVMLSHHNIISNVEAVRTVLRATPDDNICSALPFFHSLGFTGTICLPLLSGVSVCYHVNPLEGARIAELVSKNRSTILLATPTFLLAYMRKAKPADFASLRLVITGAEKLSKRIADAFKERFGIRPLEGYGATELSPVISLNIQDVEMDGILHVGSREDSVGHPLPGIAVKIVDPDTKETIPSGGSGLILVKGPNVMLGYLNRLQQTADVIQDGWYITGDIGFSDEDGFIHITDRLNRFSKIAGEMVPHKKIEDEFYAGLSKTEQSIAVTSVPDDRRGERLVVLFTKEAGDREDLQKIMAESQLPNLWKPDNNNYILIDVIPVLGSGKIDLKGLKQLALKSVKEAAIQ